MTTSEIEQAIRENESLCLWWKGTGLSMRRFIQIWHDHIVYAIRGPITGPC